MWPSDIDSLVARQRELAAAVPELWRFPPGTLRVGACWVCFPRGLTGRGGAGDPAWAAAVTMVGEEVLDVSVVTGAARAPYAPGLLALRTGELLERVVRRLAKPPEVLLVDASGRDHPRGAGLALQLGSVLGMPTVGVTHRPLCAEGPWPEDRQGATAPLMAGGAVVGCWVRTRAGARPLVVHPGWAVDLDTAVEVVDRTTPHQRRTPEPLRRARHRARLARAAAT